MTADTAAALPESAADDVMASVDDDGTTERFVIADISQDDAWISIPLCEAASLPGWQ
ncbi:MAG TPA: hypothetical protein VFJ06_04670 [Halococcus sp.]|nr:hypothetical protein [Halococcus sp.]